MRRLVPIVLACGCGHHTAAHDDAAPSHSDAAPVIAPEVRAHDVIELLRKQDFEHVVATFAPEMAKALTRDVLASTWKGLIAQLGPLGACDPATVTTAGADSKVVATCRFGAMPLDITITIDATSHLTGLHAAPAHPTTPWVPPSYAAQDSIARAVTVGAAPWALPGTLELPAGAGPFPAIVLVQGSGPNDRDETIGANRPFKDLAVGLAARGIAVLRYDKRTLVYSAKLKDDETLTVNQETVDDALAAVALLRTLPEIDPKRIFVLGHSLGGEVAPRIGQRDPKLAGLVILAGSTRPLGDVMIEQLKYLGSPPETIAQAERSVARIHELEGGAPARPKELIFFAPAAYWLDLKGYDAPALAAKLAMPMLVLQGARDYQVTQVDFANWKHALHRANVKFELYPKLDHLFVAGEGKPGPAEYSIPSHVDEQVVHDIAAWILAAH